MNPGIIMNVGIASLLFVSAAAATEPAPLTTASAVWVEDGQVELTLTYEGGACEEPQEAQVTASEIFGTDTVTIPTVETAEVCTMQIVEVEYAGTIPVEPTTDTLSVIILDPEGQPKAAGQVEIEAASGTAAE